MYSVSVFRTRVKRELGQQFNQFEWTRFYTLFYIGESIDSLHVRFLVKRFVALKTNLKIVVL